MISNILCELNSETLLSGDLLMLHAYHGPQFAFPIWKLIYGLIEIFGRKMSRFSELQLNWFLPMWNSNSHTWGEKRKEKDHKTRHLSTRICQKTTFMVTISHKKHPKNNSGNVIGHSCMFEIEKLTKSWLKALRALAVSRHLAITVQRSTIFAVASG